jgi:hypothetical protein
MAANEEGVRPPQVRHDEFESVVEMDALAQDASDARITASGLSILME